MGPRRYSATFEAGLMVSEDIPVDARTTVTSTRGERGWSVRTTSHDYSRPAEGCVADMDCPRPGRKQRGKQAACVNSECTFIPGQSIELKNLGHKVRGSGLALQDDLRRYVGDGRYAWVVPEMIGSDQRECVELAVTPSPWLPNSAALTARGEVVEWESPTEGLVREWKEVAIVDGTWRAMYRSAWVRDGQLVERSSRDLSLVTAAFSSLREDRAILNLEVYPLEALCAPTRVFARCTEGGGYGACTSTSTVLRRVSTDPPPVLSAEEPSQVRNCVVECPVSTCEAEVARWDLRLERERYQAPLKGNYALWWDRDACQASMQ